MGKTAIIVEPGKYLGGLTSGGLGATDIGNKAAIGGIAREFYHRVAEHYAREDAWKFEKADEYFQKPAAHAPPILHHSTTPSLHPPITLADLNTSESTMWT